MFTNINDYRTSRAKRLSQLDNLPLIFKWLDADHMSDTLKIIDDYIAYLVKEPGGVHKLDDWFLAGDNKFQDIAAERYIIRYLSQRNLELHDNLEREGVDALWDEPNGRIGIEVTTLGRFVGESIIVERLTEALAKSATLHNAHVHILLSSKHIQAVKDEAVYAYVNQLAAAIETNDIEALKKLEVKVSIKQLEGDGGGYLTWDIDNTEHYPLFDLITGVLWQNLGKGAKARQLKLHDRNIVFVGVNHAGPGNWMNPDLFRFLAADSAEYNLYADQIKELEDFWAANLPLLNNIIGICYFTYSLNQETPFYPLRMFWRSDNDKVPIVL